MVLDIYVMSQKGDGCFKEGTKEILDVGKKEKLLGIKKGSCQSCA